MKKYKKIIIIVNLILLLVYFNHSLTTKETILKDGKLLLLQLAPVDPRSLMQGDYMTLRYKISENFRNFDNPRIVVDSLGNVSNSVDNQNIDAKNLPRRGYCVVRIDTGVANSVRFQAKATPLNKDEYLIKYTSPNRWNVNIGAESFFFQEGQGAKYEKAKFGGVKIDKEGNSLLIGLYDEKLRKIN